MSRTKGFINEQKGQTTGQQNLHPISVETDCAASLPNPLLYLLTSKLLQAFYSLNANKFIVGEKISNRHAASIKSLRKTESNSKTMLKLACGSISSAAFSTREQSRGEETAQFLSYV